MTQSSPSPKHRGEPRRRWRRRIVPAGTIRNPEPPRPETLAQIADLDADIALLEAEEAVLRAELGPRQREDLP